MFKFYKNLNQFQQEALRRSAVQCGFVFGGAISFVMLIVFFRILWPLLILAIIGGIFFIVYNINMETIERREARKISEARWKR